MKKDFNTTLLPGVLCWIALASLLTVNTAAAARRYKPDKKSLVNYEVPEWYQDAKLGIWPHWGIYSVPAHRGGSYPAWYGRYMHCVEKGPDIRPKKGAPDTIINDFYDSRGLGIARHHHEVYGSPAKFGYHDFAPMWKAEKWNPDVWAQMAVDAGAKFFCMMGMHHDSFCLYDSDLTEWDAVDKGPNRDLVGDMAKAVRKRGLRFGVSNHMAWNSTFFRFYHKNGYSKGREDLADFYSEGVVDEAYMKRWWERTTELADKYKPDLYYFDWGWHGKPWVDGEYHEKFAAYLYNRAIEWGYGTYGKPEVVLSSKFGAMSSYCVLDLERSTMSKLQDSVWQTDTSVSPNCWGYAKDDASFFSTDHLIDTLVDIVSKNGILMLNFGPKADGTVPDEYYQRLMGMGKWLRSNGEAIYATRPWDVAGEGPSDSGGHQKVEDMFTAKDIRYTQSKDGTKIFATALGLPKGKLTLMSTKVINKTQNANVTMLANGKRIPFEINDKKQLVLNMSGIFAENAGCDHAYSYRIEGMEIEGAELQPIDLSEIYIHDLIDYLPLPGNFKSQYPYLSSVEPIFVKAHNGVKRDKNYYSEDIIIGGKKYKYGLMVCPTVNGNRGIFIIKMDKMPSIRGITAEIGIEDTATTAGTSEFIIEAYVDGKWQQLYKSRVLTYKDKAVKIDVNIPSDSNFIRFVTTDGGDGCSADHAVWANAKFRE